jgi:hypothetical protein
MFHTALGDRAGIGKENVYILAIYEESVKIKINEPK